ncbi:hypothetical protein F4808DRAFT_435267 [Astrocystis sublimbata]|nr:hypothetical protein F4808DRAFT_435267 [Astrocystis sublimbata]
MAEVVINEESLSSLKDNVVIVTGGSSGIGLTTVQLLLSLGAYVIGTDLNSPPEGAIPSSSSSSTSASSSSQFSFRAANIVDWASLVGAFKHAIELHGRVDHVFANAGIGHRTDYVRGIELDDKGDPLEPTGVVIDVNLKGAINTATLAVHYIRKNPRGGSVVMNASSTALQRFRAVDYGE